MTELNWTELNWTEQNQRIFRYQVVLMENPGLTIFSCEVLNTATILPTPEGSLSLLPRNFAPLDKTPRRIVKRSCDQFWGNLVNWWEQLCLEWKKKSWICSSFKFETIEPKPFSTRYFSPISWAHSPDSSFRPGKRKKSSHLHWLQVCLSGDTCTCCYLERKRPLDLLRVPNQIWW